MFQFIKVLPSFHVRLTHNPTILTVKAKFDLCLSEMFSVCPQIPPADEATTRSAEAASQVNFTSSVYHTVVKDPKKIMGQILHRREKGLKQTVTSPSFNSHNCGVSMLPSSPSCPVLQCHFAPLDAPVVSAGRSIPRWHSFRSYRSLRSGK